MKKIFMLLFSATLLMSCGGDGKKEEKKENSIKLNSTTAEPKNEKEDGITRVYLTGNDQMRYNKSEIKVKAGDKVVLTFEHVGKMSKETMGHNFVLLEEGTNVQEFSQEALEFKDNDYIPESSDVIIVHTEMLGGGEKTEITFQAPEKGKYDYVCSFPGHVALMNGTFIVE
ncbi:azurin [Psychroflexus sp. CAK57W]|uniref:azurin n=1 Tax=Psychroflexus curvus TaxID=2873595 RepID=UPI001CD034FD|nr:azurin [Psychroflexus curvus]MBZ9628195.1 azurin [Psychroflexus curvus]MBZ9788234.1 azurin [Psychroflexus curvus]